MPPNVKTNRLAFQPAPGFEEAERDVSLGAAPGFEETGNTRPEGALSFQPAPGFEEQDDVGELVPPVTEEVQAFEEQQPTSVNLDPPDVKTDLTLANTPVVEWTEQGFGNVEATTAAVELTREKFRQVKELSQASGQRLLDSINLDELDIDSDILSGVAGLAPRGGRSIASPFSHRRVTEEDAAETVAVATETASRIVERPAIFVDNLLRGLAQVPEYTAKAFLSSVRTVLGDDIFNFSILASFTGPRSKESVRTKMLNWLDESIETRDDAIANLNQPSIISDYFVKKQAQRYNQLYAEGNSAKIAANMIVDTIYDTTLAIALNGQITGSLYGGAGAISSTLTRAGAIGVAKYVATPGSLEERGKAGIMTMAYMATPAISGNITSKLGAKLVDFTLNSVISGTGLGIYESPIAAAIRQGYATAEERGYSEEYGMKLAALNILPVVGADAWFSAMTQSFRQGHTVRSTVEAMRRVAQKPAPPRADTEMAKMKAPPMAKTVEQMPGKAETEAYAEAWVGQLRKVTGDDTITVDNVDKINIREQVGLNLSPSRLQDLEYTQRADTQIEILKEINREFLSDDQPFSLVKAEEKIKVEKAVSQLYDPRGALSADTATEFSKAFRETLGNNETSVKAQVIDIAYAEAMKEFLSLQDYIKDNPTTLDPDVLRQSQGRITELKNMLSELGLTAKKLRQVTGRNLRALKNKVEFNGKLRTQEEIASIMEGTAQTLAFNSIGHTVLDGVRAAALLNVNARIYTEMISPLSILTLEGMTRTAAYTGSYINRYIFRNTDPTQQRFFEYKTFLKASATETGKAFVNFGKLSSLWFRTAFSKGGIFAFKRANDAIEKEVGELGSLLKQESALAIDASSANFILGTRTGKVIDTMLHALDAAFGTDQAIRSTGWNAIENALNANKAITAFISSADYANTNAFFQIQKKTLIARYTDRLVAMKKLAKEQQDNEFARLDALMSKYKNKDEAYFKDLTVEEQSLFETINQSSKSFAMESTMKGDLGVLAGWTHKQLKEHPWLALTTGSIFFKAPINTIKYALDRLPLILPRFRKRGMLGLSNKLYNELNAVTDTGAPDKAVRANAYATMAVTSSVVSLGFYYAMARMLQQSQELEDPGEYQRSRITGIPLGTNIVTKANKYININRADVARIYLGLGTSLFQRVLQKWGELASRNDKTINDQLAAVGVGLVSSATQIVIDTPAFQNAANAIRLVRQTHAAESDTTKLVSNFTDFSFSKVAGLGLLNNVLALNLLSNLDKAFDQVELREIETFLDGLRTNVVEPISRRIGIDYDNPTPARINALGDTMQTEAPGDFMDYLLHATGFRTANPDLLDETIDKLGVNSPRFDGRFYRKTIKQLDRSESISIDLKRFNGQDLRSKFLEAIRGPKEEYGGRTLRQVLTRVNKDLIRAGAPDDTIRTRLQDLINQHHDIAFAKTIEGRKDINETLARFRQDVLDRALKSREAEKLLKRFERMED